MNYVQGLAGGHCWCYCEGWGDNTNAQPVLAAGMGLLQPVHENVHKLSERHYR